MKILLINYEYPPVGAGAATATQAVAREFAALGHRPLVLTTSFADLKGEREENGIRVVRLSSRRRRCDSATIGEMVSFMLHAWFSVRRIVRRERIDGIVAFFSFPSGPAAWWANWRSPLPYVVSLRGGDVPGAEARLATIHHCLTPFRRVILRSARAVVANSSSLARLSERADPFPVAVIANGVDTTFFTPPEDERAVRIPFRLLFVGRFQEQKNLFWLLEQIADFRRTGSAAFTMDLVGDGPQRTGLEAMVEKLGLSDIVRFRGWRDRAELRSVYRSSHLLINPSLYEGMPNVVLEAMACGLPVLASRVPGNDAVVADGQTGLLYEPGNRSDFASKLVEIVSLPAKADQLSVAGRERALKEFSWTKTAESYLELLLASPQTSRAA